MKILKILKKWLPGLLIVAMLCGLIGGAYAKYVNQQTLGGTVVIKAQLGTIELREHLAKKQNDGSYVLDNGTEVQGNTYTLLPGLDVPKDPFVRITNKSLIEAYVFIEVTDTIDPADKDVITYTVDASHWLELEGVTGKNGGTVYVYAVSGQPAKVTSNIQNINILENQMVSVSQKLKQVTGGVDIHFYASMYEVASGSDAKAVYINNNS